MSLWDEIRNDLNGAALLADWIGHGLRPVQPKHAEWRSSVCLHGWKGEPCPLNRVPNWWDKVKNEIAETIRAELHLKERLKLKVKDEERLNMCKPCGCCLRLKVWTPANHIKAHTPRKVLSQMPRFCWQRIEIER